MSGHAILRYATRCDEARIERAILHDVGEGLLALRCAKDPPFGLFPSATASLYVWSEDETRVYAIAEHNSDPSKIAVLTTLRRSS